MKTKYEVAVTHKDCVDGVRNNERLCVVATAIMRAQPEASRVEANVNTIRFSLKDQGKTYRLVYATPEIVRDYIRSFDAGLEPKPMKFVLDSPQIAEKESKPPGTAVTPSFKASGPSKKRRSVRVFGEKTFQQAES